MGRQYSELCPGKNEGNKEVDKGVWATTSGHQLPQTSAGGLSEHMMRPASTVPNMPPVELYQEVAALFIGWQPEGSKRTRVKGVSTAAGLRQQRTAHWLTTPEQREEGDDCFWAAASTAPEGR